MVIKRWFHDLDCAKAFVEGVEYVNDSAIKVLVIEPGANEKHISGWNVVLADQDR